MKYEMWKAEDGLWYWHLRSGNNEIVAQGEGYKNRQHCIDAVNLVMDTNRQTRFVDLSSN